MHPRYFVVFWYLDMTDVGWIMVSCRVLSISCIVVGWDVSGWSLVHLYVRMVIVGIIVMSTHVLSVILVTLLVTEIDLLPRIVWVWDMVTLVVTEVRLRIILGVWVPQIWMIATQLTWG